ncbi:MAG: DNA-binding transcriptional regulator [Opitutales bacterium]|nr:DNA-binding transcriptional regulator [Opitutales bacterium]
MPAKKRNKKRKIQNTRVKRVALLLESDMAFDRAIARGVGEFIRSRSGWVILMDPMTKATLEGVKYWDPDGVITSIHLPAINEIAQLANVPKVGFGSYSEEQDGHLKFPIVTSNQEEIGRMAARYFLNKGMRNFAFCGGDEKALWCRQRREGFSQELKKNGHICENYEPDFPSPTHMPDAIRSLGLWLESLPKPCGVFVFFDGWARWVLDACVIQQLQVPQEISVLGVDNDRWLCELSQPRLSSIDANAMMAGYTAADILDRLMSGDSTCPSLSHIAPAKVEERDSSSYMGFEDPEVAFAMRYIKEHACNPITPADVLKVTGMSNSTAYRKFMKNIGRSIHSEIQRIQMERVKELLTSTNLNITSIAKQAGFENIRYLTQVFRDASGFTPTEYRRVHSTPDVSDSGSSKT